MTNRTGNQRKPQQTPKDDSLQSKPSGSVCVVYGVNRLDSLNIEGKTVGQVRNKLSTALNIPDNVEMLVSGERVRPDHKLKAGDVLEFVKLAGSKG